MIIERYCTCGAVLKVNIPARKKAQTLSIWYAQHSDHADTTAAAAEQARMGFGQPGGREAMKERDGHGS